MQTLYDGNHFQAANDHADSLLKRQSEDPAQYVLILIMKAKSLLRLGKTQEAREIIGEASAFKTILANNPHYRGLILEFEAENLLLDAKNAEALEQLKSALAILDKNSTSFQEASQRLKAVEKFQQTGIWSLTPPKSLVNLRSLIFILFFLVSLASFVINVWQAAHYVDASSVMGGSLSPELFSILYNGLFFGIMVCMTVFIVCFHEIKKNQRGGGIHLTDLKEFLGYFGAAIALYTNFIDAILLPKDIFFTVLIFIAVFILSSLEKEQFMAKVWFVISFLGIVFLSWNSIRLDPLENIEDLSTRWAYYSFIFATIVILLLLVTLFLYRTFDKSFNVASLFFTIFSSAFSIYPALSKILNQNPAILFTIFMLVGAFAFAFIVGVWPKLKARKISKRIQEIKQKYCA